MYGFSNGGVIIATITPNGGAAKAGIKPGDILVTIDHKQITSGDFLVDDISARPVGSSVVVGYLRDGKQHEATITIGDRAQVYKEIAGGPEDLRRRRPPTPARPSWALP